MRLTILAFVIAATTGACDSTMSGTDGIQSSLSGAASEDEAYLAAARATSTMPDMLVLVGRHATRMDAILGDMTDHMGSMQHCSGMQAMMRSRDEMSVEMDSHVTTMHQVTNVPDARTEVEHHVGAMQSMMDDMQSMLDGLRCP